MLETVEYMMSVHGVVPRLSDKILCTMSRAVPSLKVIEWANS